MQLDTSKVSFVWQQVKFNIKIAHAKMHLRTEVTKQDVEEARRVMLKSFIKTQRFSVQQILYRKFKKYL